MTHTKPCIKCGERKSLVEFYKHPAMLDGHLNTCIACHRSEVKVNRARKRERYSVYEKRRKLTPKRLEQRAASQARHREKYPERYKARTAVGNALRDGRLQRQPCERCGSTHRVQAHHKDYSRPLDVKWLCFTCHREQEHGQVVVATF